MGVSTQKCLAYMIHGEGSVNPVCSLHPASFAAPHSVHPDLTSLHPGVPSPDDRPKQVQPPPQSPVPCMHTLPKTDSSSGGLVFKQYWVPKSQAPLPLCLFFLLLHYHTLNYLHRPPFLSCVFYSTVSLSHTNLHCRTLSLVIRTVGGRPVYP